MNYIVPLVVSGIFVILLLVTIANRPWNRPQKLFILYLIASAIWSGSDFLLRSNLFLDYKLLVFRIVILSSLWWAVQLFYFARAFLDLPGGHGLLFGYAALALFIALVFLGYAPPGIKFEQGIIIPVYGWWFFCYVAPLVILTVIGVYSLVLRIRRSSSAEERNKTGYLATAAVILAIFGITGITPLANTFPISHLGGLLSAGVLTYAIFQHELVSINLVLRRTLGITCLGITIGGAYLTLLFLILRFFNVEHYAYVLLFSVIAGILVTGFAIWLRPRFLGKLEKIFYREKYEHRRKLLDFVKLHINRVYNLQDLSSGLLPPLVNALSCQKACMLLPSQVTGDFSIEASEPQPERKVGFKIKKDSSMVAALRHEYLSREDIEINPGFRGVWEEERRGLRDLNIELLFPLINRQNMVGILALGKKQSGKYSVEDINLIESIAGQVAVSLEREYYHEELRKREKELALINRLSSIMSSSLDIHEVYDGFISGLKEVVDINFAAIALIEENMVSISAMLSEVGAIWNVGDVIPSKSTATEWVVKQKKSFYEPDLSIDRVFDTGEKYLRQGLRSIVYLPLIVKNEGIGSLILSSRNPQAYSREQVDLLERLTAQIATSIDNTQLYARAEHRARVDELTGLFNRRHFDEVLLREIQRHSRLGSSFSVAFIDIDLFKSYNDISGHAAGDRLLKQIAQVIKSTIRGIDVAFRYGGDEFAVIISHTNVDDAWNVAERMRARTAESLLVNVTMSIGLASWPNDGLSADELIKASDTALYHAKRTGGNRTCVISQVLPGEAKKDAKPSDNESLNTIYALAATIEARDAYTYGHSRKVRSYAVALAESLKAAHR